MMTRRFTVKDQIRALFRHKRVIAATMAGMTGLAMIGAGLKMPVYAAHVKMLGVSKEDSGQPYAGRLIDSSPGKITMTQSELVRSDPVISQVVRILRLTERTIASERGHAPFVRRLLIDARAGLRMAERDTAVSDAQLFTRAVDDLRKKIDIEPVRDADVFIIGVRDHNPVYAARIANAVSRAYCLFKLEQRSVILQQQYGQKHPFVTQIKDSIDQLRGTLGGEYLGSLEGLGAGTIKIVEQAHVPVRPEGPGGRSTVLGIFFLSIVLGAGFALVIEYADQTIRSPHDFTEALHVPFLGGVPASGRGPACRNLAERIYLDLKKNSHRTAVITSFSDGDGAQSLAGDILRSLSGFVPGKILYIDLQAGFNGNNAADVGQAGIGDILEGRSALRESVVEVTGNLHMLPRGRSHGSLALLMEARLADFVEAARRTYALMFLHCPPLRHSGDAAAVSSCMQGYVVVAADGTMHKGAAGALLGRLAERDVRFIGGIINKRTFPIPEYFYRRVS